MIRIPTLAVGAMLGLGALGASTTASGGVHVAVGIGLPAVVTPAVVAAPAVVPAPAVVAARPPVVLTGPVVAVHPPVYYGTPFYSHPRVVVGWRPGYVVRGGYHWHR